MYIFDNILKYNYQLKFSSLMGYFFYNFNSDCYHTKTTFGSLQVIFENPVIGDCKIFFCNWRGGGTRSAPFGVLLSSKRRVCAAHGRTRGPKPLVFNKDTTPLNGTCST
jgi:hypothetical protein